MGGEVDHQLTHPNKKIVRALDVKGVGIGVILRGAFKKAYFW